jgi:hypothetical protein
MKRHTFAASLALAVVSILVPAGRATAGQQVPFKGSLDGVATVTPLAPPVVFVLVEGGGTATHLGQFSVSIPHLVNRSNSTVVGSYVFTAANGDTLTADFTGLVTATDVPGVRLTVDTATITGGTGRFAGATGSFTVERLVDTTAGTTAGSFMGTISTPGAAKRQN